MCAYAARSGARKPVRYEIREGVQQAASRSENRQQRVCGVTLHAWQLVACATFDRVTWLRILELATKSGAHRGTRGTAPLPVFLLRSPTPPDHSTCTGHANGQVSIHTANSAFHSGSLYSQAVCRESTVGMVRVGRCVRPNAKEAATGAVSVFGSALECLPIKKV